MHARIFVVDDHAVTRKGYIYLLDEEPDLEVVGEADSCMAALSQLAELQVDLVIADVSMQGLSGLDLVKHLAPVRPELPVLLVSMHDEAVYAERALQAGARGYLMKSDASTQVIIAIRKILAGGVYLSDAMNARLLLRMAGRLAPAGAAASTAHRKEEGRATGLTHLSDRELSVFEHLGRGLKTSEIAQVLLISRSTVGSYCERLKEKLNAEDHAALVRLATLHYERT
ncbi:MAG: response regulator transcription factor [Bacteroidota bacterium]